ncbi:MAG TPA: response regulator transcription factor [Anaerolineaceae bacterium]|nr:response regulator transcription factor [Anaerolineaceae bacterium]
MNPKPHVLVIDDEKQILRALRTILGQQGYQVTVAVTGEEGLSLAAAAQPDVIILDLGLPDLSGEHVCRRLREWTDLPIIILSAHDSESEKVAALDAGADDYLTKPFGVDELLARLRVALRHSTRAQGSRSSILSSGQLTIDLAKHLVTRGGQPVKLTATEYKLLAYLASNAGRVLTHQAILTHVWGYAAESPMEYLRVYIRQLRQKLEEDPHNPQLILTESGVGYRMMV